MTYEEMVKKFGGEGNKTQRISVKDLKPRSYDIIVAIDPDIEKSGVCVLYTGCNTIFMHKFSFPELIDAFYRLQQNVEDWKESVLICVEAGWLNQKSCFHTAQGRGAEKIAKDVGRNQQTGILALEMAQHMGFHTEEIAPLEKKSCHWHGQDGKVANEDLAQFIPNYKTLGRLSQDQRDALLIAWTRAGNPIDCNRTHFNNIISKNYGTESTKVG